MSVFRRVARAVPLLALIAGGVVVALLVGFYAENRDSPMMPSPRWLGWIGYTVLIAVFVLREHWQHTGRVSFWVALFGLFSAHTAIYAIAFQELREWRGMWFLPLSIAEYAVFLVTLHLLGYRDNSGNAAPKARRRIR